MKVLVVEDDSDIARILKKGLSADRWTVEIATNGTDGISYARLNTYDVVVLDLHLGDMHGSVVADSIRIYSPGIPILALSVTTDLSTKLDMLAVCDDYMTKPFALDELTARLRALTRRSPTIADPVLCAGCLTLDTARFVVSVEGNLVPLRNKEFALLEYLMKHQDVVLSRETILSHVWDMNADPFTNTVDTHIRLLRKKLEAPHRAFIHTVPKRGYRFSSADL